MKATFLLQTFPFWIISHSAPMTYHITCWMMWILAYKLVVEDPFICQIKLLPPQILSFILTWNFSYRYQLPKGSSIIPTWCKFWSHHNLLGLHPLWLPPISQTLYPPKKCYSPSIVGDIIWICHYNMKSTFPHIWFLFVVAIIWTTRMVY